MKQTRAMWPKDKLPKAYRLWSNDEQLTYLLRQLSSRVIANKFNTTEGDYFIILQEEEEEMK